MTNHQKRSFSQEFAWTALLAISACCFVFSSDVLAQKGSAPAYEDPFDRGSGGASLTRAAQGGIPHANPALMTYGDGFHRWVGIEPSLIVGKDSADFARSFSSNSSNEESDPSALVDSLTKTPIHMGVMQSTSYINRNFALGVFNRLEPDLFARRYGETGLPEVTMTAESYHGATVSFAQQIIGKFLSVGVTSKYLYAAEPKIAIEVTDQESIKKLQSSSGMSSLIKHNTGIGYDLGLMSLIQGQTIDFSLAAKVDDLGGTSLKGEGSLEVLPQIISAGMAMTLHSSTDALHLALDYRDIQGAYEEKLFKRIRVSSKLLIRRYVGFGAGILDGNPSYAAELDLILLRLTASYYKRELGESPGVKSRPIYSFGLAMGF